ncbi:complement C3-like [Leptodactylus fuscus]
MGCRLLALALLALLAGCFGQPCTLITPSVLHLESEETIVIDGHNKAFEADIEIQDLLRKTLVKQKLSLNNGNQFLGTTKVKIPSEDFVRQPKTKQYVNVTMRSPVCNMEKIVLLGYQSGYIVIQTDKTIYTPGSTVLFRIFSMDYKMSPLNKTLIIEFLTPENKIVKRDTALPEGNSGITSLSYRLPDLASLGVWTISAKFQTTPQQTYTANFEVKEYVLPSFEIQLIPEQKYFYIDGREFYVDIKARFFYGKPVNGIAFVVFGAKKGDARISLQDTLRRIVITDGEGRAVMRREDLVKRLSDGDEMLQYTLYMSVTINTDIGSEIVESELEDIPIVRSPFNVLFTKTSKYFKPGIPYDLTVFVTNPDGSPAIRIPVVAEPGSLKGITGPEGTARLTLNTRLDTNVLPITVRTSHSALQTSQQATASMTANAHQSGGNYLHIFITVAQVKPGEYLAVNFNIRNTNMAAQNQIQHITYLIMNKGRILKVERLSCQPSQVVVFMNLPITEEFVPSFRIVAYYIAGNEIVSDSIWVEVTDSCMVSLSVTGNSYTKIYNTVQSPSSSMRLQLQADHMANVGFVAVDKGVYGLNSKFKISQRKLLEFLETSDHGCSPGSGADGMAVFYDAGLALQSSLQTTTPQRSGSKYKAPVRRCCADGMYPSSLSCERQAETITEGKECVDAFLDCCKYIEQKRKEEINGTEQDEGSRREDDDEYLPDDEIFSRSEFPESWFWRIEQMRERPDNKGISTKVLNVFLKESITAWEVLAVSLSQNKGLCIAKPLDIQVMKDVFLDLELPNSAMRQEQVEIRALLYNYGFVNIKVRVELTYNPHFCGHSTAKNKFRQIVDIEPQSSVAVPFTLVPLILGDLTVEVKAAVFEHFLSDGVVKKLKVVPEGVRVTKLIKSVTLDPQVKGQDGVQEETILPMDETSIVPGADIETIVTIQDSWVTSEPQGYPVIMMEDVVNAANLRLLMVVPYGNGEENLMRLTPTIIATIYLDATKQWEKIGGNQRDEALKNIKKGYVQQLAYRKTDSSYATNKDTASSTWLTACVVKFFALAHPLVDIDSNVLCDAVKWLILVSQKPNGRFQENDPVTQQDLVGGINWSSDDVALTAFVLIAMLESEKICSPHVNNLKVGIEKATNFLLDQYQSLVKPYTIAITSYALAMAGSITNREKLLSGAIDKVQWNDPGDQIITIEATSYALLALLRLKQYHLTGPVVRWMKDQQFYGAAYGSTQATIVMFQAVAQYHMDITSLSDIAMEVTLLLPGKSSISYHIDPDNAMVTRSAVTSINKEIVVKAKGKGQVTLTVTSHYHALQTVIGRENFDLSVTVKEEKAVRGAEWSLGTASVEICARHLKDNDATMSILEVSMMTGFIPDVESLNKLKRYISKYEINKEAADKGTLRIYLDKISHKQDECIKFIAHQIFRVGQIQPGSVTVYEYYAPGR